MNNLIPVEDINVQRLSEYLKSKSEEVYIAHDIEFGAVTFSIVSPEINVYIHYLTEHIALICENESNSIVGFQVEI